MSARGEQFLPWLFPRFLAGVYLPAFASLLVQVRGLYGERGILPIAAYLKGLRSGLGRGAGGSSSLVGRFPIMTLPKKRWGVGTTADQRERLFVLS
jgi:hypothetical protein